MSDTKNLKRQLAIKTGVVKRLVKEEKTYIKEAEEQEQRIARFQEEGKEEWEVKQQRKVLVDCQKMVPDTRKRLEAATDDLQGIVDGLDGELLECDEAKAALAALQSASEAAQA